MTDPLGHTVTILNEAAGQPIAITDTAGNTRLAYDSGYRWR